MPLLAIWKSGRILRMRNPSSLFENFALFAFLLIIQFVSVSSVPCSCTPLTYRWTLDLSSSCPSEIPVNEGIGSDSFCKIFTTTVDPVVKVTRVQFLEYGETLADLFTYYEESGEWLDGDEMSVESITSGDPSVYTTAAGFELDGYTSAGNKVVLQWIVNYTNECEKDPYENLSSIAWLQFADQTPSLISTCISSDNPTNNSKSPKAPKSKSPKSFKSSWSYKSPKSAKSSKATKSPKSSSKSSKSSKDSKSKISKSAKSSWSYKSPKSSKASKSSKSEKSSKAAWSKGGYRQ